MIYDNSNIFARILRGELPSKKIYDDERVLAFHNIHPEKKIHAMIVCKAAFTDIQDFSENATDQDIIALIRAVPKVAKALDIAQSGYRLITNCRAHSGQEIPHLHFHMLGGEAVGRLVE